MTKRISLHGAFMAAGFSILAGATIYMSEITWVPDWLGAWADKNPDLRTAVPFFLLSLMCPAATCLPGRGNRDQKQARNCPLDYHFIAVGYTATLILLVTTECSQYFIPSRFPNIVDILYGIVGVSLGAVTGLPVWVQLQTRSRRRFSRAGVAQSH
jgi:hypothetical protein